MRNKRNKNHDENNEKIKKMKRNQKKKIDLVYVSATTREKETQ